MVLGTTTGAGQGPIATFTKTNGTILAGQSSQTYSDVTGVTSANGVNAKFDVVRDGTGAISSVTIADAGSGYTPTETITILGSSIGGVDTTDDIVIIVASIVPVEKLGYIVDYSEVVTPLIGTTKPVSYTHLTLPTILRV